MTSQERSTLVGLKRVAELGLSSMEIEFVRGVAMKNDLADEVGDLAKELGIELSVHCPYFINLCSAEEEKIKASQKRILDSVERCHHMGARVAVFHPGYYGSLSPEAAYDMVKRAELEMRDEMKSRGMKGVVLGNETTGKMSAVGNLDELIRLCREVPECQPVIDFAHLWARGAGTISYPDIFEKLKPLNLKHLHCHFTSMEWTPGKIPGTGNERRHLPISFDEPPVEPLVKEIIKRKLDITIISESPVLEQDSLVMKKMFEKLGHRF